MFWSSKKEVPVNGGSIESAIANIKMLSKDYRDLAVVVDEF